MAHILEANEVNESYSQESAERGNERALILHPALRVVKLADGTADDRSYLSDTLPWGDDCFGFYHANGCPCEADAGRGLWGRAEVSQVI
jgi:hypothetical protein